MIKNSFYYRHSQFQEFAPDQFCIDEHFWINQESEQSVPDGMLYCIAYGECVWRKGGRFLQKKSRYSGKSQRSFEYTVEGIANVQYEGNLHHLQEGDLFISGPEDKIERSVDKQGYFLKRVAIFSGELIDYLYSFNSNYTTRAIRIEDRGRIAKIYDSIRETVTKGSSHPAGDLSVLGFALFSELAINIAVSKYPPALRKMLDFIGTHLNSSLTLQTLCGESHCSLSSLNRLFRRHLETSPIDYIVNRRLERAKHLMKMHDLSLKEIADQCGYKTESFFSRSFKSKYGVSPKEYRKSLAD